MSIKKLSTPGEVRTRIAQKFKRARLHREHSRSKAAALTGIPESTLRAFETKAEISLRQFIMLCHVYGDLTSFESLFPEEAPQTMEQLLATEREPERQRGRS